VLVVGLVVVVVVVHKHKSAADSGYLGM